MRKKKEIKSIELLKKYSCKCSPESCGTLQIKMALQNVITMEHKFDKHDCHNIEQCQSVSDILFHMSVLFEGKTI